MNASCNNTSYRKIFSQHGCKLTHQRLEIYRQLSDCDDHPSAEVLYQRVADKLPIISLETVYRALNKFEKLGMAHKVHTTDRLAHYDAKVDPHCHFICNKCYCIKDLNLDEIDLSRIHPAVNELGQVDSIDLVLTGGCRKCLENEAMPPE